MEVAQQFGASRGILAVDGAFLLRQMLAQGADFCWRRLAHKGARHLRLQHAAHREHLACLDRRRRGHKGTTRRLQSDKLVLRQLQQRLSHQRTRHAKMVGQFLLGQFAARLQAMFDNRLGQRLHDQLGG